MLRRNVAEPRSACSSSIPKSVANGTLFIACLIFVISASLSVPLSSTVALSGTGRLDDNSGTVGENFGHAGREFGGVVTRSDDSVGADLCCVLDHDLKSIDTSLFTERGPDRDVPADDGLQRSADRRKDVARADDNPADHAEVLHDAIIRQLECRCYHLMRNGIARWTDVVWHSSL